MNSDAIDLSEQLQVGLYVKIWIFSIAFEKRGREFRPQMGAFWVRESPQNAGQIQV